MTNLMGRLAPRGAPGAWLDASRPALAEPSTAPSLACDLTALDPAARAPQLAQAAYLRGVAAQERQELPDGYAVR